MSKPELAEMPTNESGILKGAITTALDLAIFVAVACIMFPSNAFLNDLLDNSPQWFLTAGIPFIVVSLVVGLVITLWRNPSHYRLGPYLGGVLVLLSSNWGLWEAFDRNLAAAPTIVLFLNIFSVFVAAAIPGLIWLLRSRDLM